MPKKLIGKGAEAVIYLEKESDQVIKERITKNYRIKEIDERFRKFRTRREAKVLEKLSEINFSSPRVTVMDDKKMIVRMEFIKGYKLRDILEKKGYKKISRDIGERIAEMHNTGIMHADLTTSNMILQNNKVFFVDFGLSFFSTKIEDRAVDLHLLRQALESKHYRVWGECYEEVLKGYRKLAKEADAVISRLDVVEKRGRYKKKSIH